MTTEVARDGKLKERRSLRTDRPAEALDAARERERVANENSGLYRTRRAGRAEHAVFLLPGLLGFEHFSTFHYFGERVVAALRAGLEARLGMPVPVIAVPVPPAATLRQRQGKLIKTLADRLHTLEHGNKPMSVHLVGHSTGGLDANLLTLRTPLGGWTWADLDPRAPALQDRIRTVVSIASPQQGACIARDPVARVISHRDPRGLPSFADLLGRFTLSAIKDVELGDLTTSASREARKTYRFVREVLSKWELLGDLQPTYAIDPRALRPGVRRRSFVTVTGQARLGDASIAPADAFFRALAERASGWHNGSAEQGERVLASVARLNHVLGSELAGDLLIKADGIELPARLDAGHNDGVVNAARQLIDPNDPDELAGIVVGDHFDVVGYYDRHAWTLDDQGNEQSSQVLSGLLHSGSGFRDDQFFDLYRRVSEQIAGAAG
jgi:pimeloyl-ACP methyl ester carboxylesterase